MNLTDVLQQALSGGAINQISQAIGADEQTTGTAIQSALPMLLSGLASNSQSEQGASSLLGALDRDHDGSALDDIAGLVGNLAQGQSGGDSILGHIFGGQTSSIAQGVSQASGLDASKVGSLLSMLAPIVMGAIGRTQRESGIGAGDLAGLLGGAAQQFGGGDLMGMVSNLLDRDQDGSPVDDVLGMLGGLFKK
jgi:hypothetical protein